MVVLTSIIFIDVFISVFILCVCVCLVIGDSYSIDGGKIKMFQNHENM